MPHFFTVGILWYFSSLSKGDLILKHHLNVHMNTNLEVNFDSLENVGPVSGRSDACKTSRLSTAKSFTLRNLSYHLGFIPGRLYMWHLYYSPTLNTHNLHISQHSTDFFFACFWPHMPSTSRSQSRAELAETVPLIPRTHPPAAPAAPAFPGGRGVCCHHITRWVKTLLRRLNTYRDNEALSSQSVNPPLISVEITSQHQPNLTEN